MLSAFPVFPSTDGLFGVPFPTFEGGFIPWDFQEPLFPSHQQEQFFLPSNITEEPVMSNSGSENSKLCPVFSNSASTEPNRNLDNSSQEHLFSFPKQDPAFSPDEIHEPVITNSGSEKSIPNHSISPSGSHDPDRNMDNSSPGSDETNQTGCVLDERKRKRMISNRESAKRSRMRKKEHLENLRNQVTRLKIVNRELGNRFRLVTQHCQFLRRENDRFQSESAMLRQRLGALQQVLLVRELQPFPPSAWPCKTITSFNEQNIAS